MALGLAIGGRSLLCRYAKANGTVSEHVRKLTKLGDPSVKPSLLILDIPDNGGYYVKQDTEVTVATVKAFVQLYRQRRLERQQLGLGPLWRPNQGAPS